MKTIRFCHRWSILTSVLLLNMLGCQCNSSPRNVVSEIRVFVEALAKAGEDGNIDLIDQSLTDDFFGDGRYFGGHRQNLIRGLQMFFLRGRQRHVLYRARSIEIEEGNQQAVVGIYAILTSFPLSFQQFSAQTRADILAIELQLQYTSHWRVKRASWKRAPFLNHINDVLGDVD